MTNEEIIRALEHIRSAIRNHIPPTKPGKAIEAIDLAIAALERDRWISVEERLPDFEGACLCMRKSYVCPGMRHQEIMYVDENGFYNIDDVYAEPGNVTHWRPLPEPPKEDKP